MQYKKSVIFLFHYFVSVCGVFSQEPLIRHFTTNHGISSANVYSMVQDKDGFIWLGTDIGVSRFDGNEFRNFSMKDGLPENLRTTIRKDSKGRIWILGFNGTVSYWFQGKIFNESSDTMLRHMKSSMYYFNLIEDNENRLWFVEPHGYLILDNKSVTRLAIENNSIYTGHVINGRKGQVLLNVSSSFDTNNDTLFCSRYIAGSEHPIKFKYNVWHCADGSLRLTDGSTYFLAKEGIIWQKDTVQKLVIPINGEFEYARVFSMAMSADSQLWISATGKGLYCYDMSNPLKKPMVYFRDKITREVLIDWEGNTWVCCLMDGLYMITAAGKNVTVYPKEGAFPKIKYLAVNKLGSQYLSGYDQSRVVSFSNEHSTPLHLPLGDELHNFVHRIASKNDDIWIATDAGLIHVNEKTGCNHYLDDGTDENGYLNGVEDLALGKDNIYAAGRYNIHEYPLRCAGNFNKRKPIHKDFIRNLCVHYDYIGQIWYSNKFGFFSKKDNVIVDHSGEDKLLRKKLNSIAETNDSVLVIATQGYGILFYKNGRILNRITMSDGISDDICRRVFVHKNHIYVATPSGLSVLFYSKGRVLKIHNLTTGNYLPSNDVNDVYVDDAEIVVATMTGIAVIKQDALRNSNPKIPVLNILEIKQNDSIISADKKKTFPHDIKNLKISFIGICFQQPDEVNYRYRLRGDQIWQSTENTELEFSFLAPGNYHFQLQARVGEGRWSPAKSFSFTITPPFWKTIWFMLLSVIIFGALVFFVVKHRLNVVRNRSEAKAEFERQIADLRQQALQTMMNPHFIFNVMNSIQHLINDNNKEAANHYLSDFAALIRMNLSISYKKIILIEEEVEYLNLYLSFEKLRFGDNLSYEIRVDTAIEVSETMVTVMMIQPFIENAIWHGILPMKNAGHIHIQIDKAAEDLIKITVEDNGVGIDDKFIGADFKTHSNESHALNMTVQRLNLLSKATGRELYLRFKHAHPEQENKGTVAELVLPVTFY